MARTYNSHINYTGSRIALVNWFTTFLLHQVNKLLVLGVIPDYHNNPKSHYMYI